MDFLILWSPQLFDASLGERSLKKNIDSAVNEITKTGIYGHDVSVSSGKDENGESVLTFDMSPKP